MIADAHARMAYLAETAPILWPGGAAQPMVVLPGERAPRVLVPLRPRRAGVAAVLRYTAQQGLADRAKSLALSAAIGAGWATRRPVAVGVRAVAGPDATSIDDYLSTALGQPVCSVLTLTRDRPNRKPVLQVLDRRGRTIAFAKIGISELAGRLVADETAALRAIAAAGPRDVAVPVVRHSGRWCGRPTLVTSTLPMATPIALDHPGLDAAMQAVARTGDGALGGYVRSVRERSRAVGAAADEWRGLFDAAADGAVVRVGAWHGDWTTWNCGVSKGRVQVWDWERYSAPAPLGFDKLHFALNDTVAVGQGRFGPAAELLVRRAPELLAPWGLDRSHSVTVALLYLLDIALRYLADDAAASGAAGRIGDWALPVVRSHLAHRPRGGGR